MKLKVLFVFNSLPQGGAERQAIYLANGLSKRGIDVAFCIYSKKSTFYKNLVQKFNLRVFEKNNYSIYDKLNFILKKISEYNPTIIITFMSHNGMILRILKLIRFSKIPIIYGIRNTYKNYFSWNYFSDFLLSFFSYNVYNSKASLKQMHKCNRHFYIPNGYESNWKKTSENNTKIIKKKFAIIARLLDQKNQIQVIKAFSELKKQGYTNFELHLYGDMSDTIYLDKINELILINDLEKNILVQGTTENIRSVYSSMDCIIIPSKHEGCPNVLFESILSKRLVLISNASNSGNFVNSNHCLIYSDFNQLKQYLSEILDDIDFSNLVSNAFDEVDKKYSIKKMVDSYHDLINLIVENDNS